MKGKKRIGLSRKGIYWDYNYDGIFPIERMTTFWKRYWNKWKARLDAKHSKKDLDE